MHKIPCARSKCSRGRSQILSDARKLNFFSFPILLTAILVSLLTGSTSCMQLLLVGILMVLPSSASCGLQYNSVSLSKFYSVVSQGLHAGTSPSHTLPQWLTLATEEDSPTNTHVSSLHDSKPREQHCLMQFPTWNGAWSPGITSVEAFFCCCFLEQKIPQAFPFEVRHLAVWGLIMVLALFIPFWSRSFFNLISFSKSIGFNIKFPDVLFLPNCSFCIYFLLCLLFFIVDLHKS